MNTIEKIKLPLFQDKRGCLLVIEQEPEIIPFVPVRTFILTRVSANQKRACHAVDCHLFLLCSRGTVTVLNKKKDSTITKWILDSDDSGLLIPPYYYIELTDFSPESLLIVSASKKFKDTQYFSFDSAEVK